MPERFLNFLKSIDSRYEYGDGTKMADDAIAAVKWIDGKIKQDVIEQSSIATAHAARVAHFQ